MSRALALSKSWQFNVNQVIKQTGVTNTDFRTLMLAIKNALIGFSSHPWTVVGSNNTVAAGLDAVDRWTVIGDLVWSLGSTASWIVLTNAGLGTYQLLISLEGSSGAGSNFEIRASPGGLYTGGATNARPTATDEIIIGSTIPWCDSGLTSRVRTALHVAMSTDGQCTRIWMCTQQGLVTGCWIFDKLSDAVFSVPVVALIQASSSHALTFAGLITSSSNWKVRANGGLISAIGTAEAFGTSVLPTGTSTNFDSDLDQTWPVEPMGLATQTRGAAGHLGTFQDLWCASAQLAVGQMLGTSRKAVSLSPLIMPWDGVSDMLVGG